MKKREKGGLVALFIFLIMFIALGVFLASLAVKPREPRREILAEEYDPEEINVEKLVAENGKVYFSFKGVAEKYADFIETELEKEGLKLSEIESPDDYEEILTVDEFEKITNIVELLREIEGEWIEADEEELVDFIRANFPETGETEVLAFSKNLVKGAKSLEKEEIDEYYTLDDLVLRLGGAD